MNALDRAVRRESECEIIKKTTKSIIASSSIVGLAVVLASCAELSESIARDDIDAVFKLSEREFDKLANIDFSEVKLVEGSDTEAANIESESEDG